MTAATGPARPWRRWALHPLSIALYYAVFSALWILLSDRAVGWLVPDPGQALLLNTVKGWFFVAVTSMLLYGLLLRWQAQHERPRQPDTPHSDHAPRVPLLAVTLLGLTIVGLTTLSIAQRYRSAKDVAAAQLQAIADAKAQQLWDWHQERLDNARLLQHDQDLRSHWLAWQAERHPTHLLHLRERLARFANGVHFTRAHLVGPQGVAVTPPEETPPAPDPTLDAGVAQALAEGRPLRIGPWRDGLGAPRLAFIAPLVTQGPHPAAVVLHVDPVGSVHHSLDSWPLPETSAESFLFRQDGDQVLFLSPLRYEPEAALRKRLPLDAPELLTARVLRGAAPLGTALEGNDYRGVPVLAVARRIGDTEWWMLVKQDRDELMTGAVVSGLTMALAGVLGLFAVGVGLYLHQQRRELRRSSRDLDELRRTRQALQDSEQRYRLLADNATDVIWLYDLRSKRFEYVSPSVVRLRGYTQEEALAQGLDETLTPDSALAVREQLPWRLQAFADGDELMRTQVNEVAQRCRDGRSVLTEVVSTLIPDEHGAVAKVLGVTRDITTRKRQEAQIVQLSQATEQSPAGVIITNLQGQIEYVNRAFERLTGYTSAEALGRNPNLLQSGKTPPDRYTAMWAALHAGRPWTGEVVNRHKDGHEMVQSVTIAPVRNAHGRVTHYLSVQLDVTAQRDAEAKAHRLAWFDPLTGLPNRQQLLDTLQRSLGEPHRQPLQSALLLINIDRFKTLNDALSHAAGDQLLQQMAQRLQALQQPGELLARPGGDEFALLLHHGPRGGGNASSEAMHRANAVHLALAQPFERPGAAALNVSASIGVALLPDGPADEPSAVLRRADTALHRAKEAGGQQTAFFDADMGQVVSQRFAIEQDLRRGLDAGELRLYLQPQVNADGHTVSAEALVRWQHPDRGLVPPGLFIPVAEESGLIDQLGTWVLGEVCQHLGALHRAGLRRPISVNISPRQFHDPRFIPELLALLARTGAQAADLILEITEGVVVQKIDTVIHRMGELNRHGVRFSIDDFGTGYSSLSYLKNLPIHELKIDRSFVQDAPNDPSDAALVEAILSVARHLRLRVVAEGVETPEQAAFFTRHPGVLMQGYLFGRPEPAQALLDRWLAAQA